MSNNPGEFSQAAQEELEMIIKQAVRLFQEAAQEVCARAASRIKIKPAAKAGIILKP
jgi:hypothetical protein